MAKSTHCRECVKDAIYCCGPAVLMELHTVTKVVHRECFKSAKPDECYYGLVPNTYRILVCAALLSIVTYPILYACFRSPWLGCMPWIGSAFDTRAHHRHLIPLMGLIYRRTQQLFWIVVAKIEEMIFWSPFDTPPFQSDAFITHAEAEIGSLNPTPQWILPANYGELGARRQT